MTFGTTLYCKQNEASSPHRYALIAWLFGSSIPRVWVWNETWNGVDSTSLPEHAMIMRQFHISSIEGTLANEADNTRSGTICAALSMDGFFAKSLTGVRHGCSQAVARRISGQLELEWYVLV